MGRKKKNLLSKEFIQTQNIAGGMRFHLGLRLSAAINRWESHQLPFLFVAADKRQVPTGNNSHLLSVAKYQTLGQSLYPYLMFTPPL